MLPYIARDASGFFTFYVNNKPFMIRGGELHNSSSSSISYMNSMVWSYLRKLHLNTIILPVSWEIVEKEKGKYDFSLTKAIIDRARMEGYRLILIWFGLWKNGESTYIPGWMKEDVETYFLCRDRHGRETRTISPFCMAAVDADMRAYVAFMHFLKEYDGVQNTVIMIQLENEIGCRDLNRDYSAEAQKILAGVVPEQMVQATGKNGSWHEAFGEKLDDYLMTWGFAQAIEQLAVAGKKEYALPVYINNWLYLYPYRPGTYPTGGPIAPMLDVWKKLAPSIDLFAPDIYHSNFHGVCDQFIREYNPLFIPEARRDHVTVSNALYAFAQYKCLGFSPFGIEDFLNPNATINILDEQLASLNIDALGFHCIEGTGELLSKAYSILEEMEDLYFSNRHRIFGFIQKNEHHVGDTFRLGKYELDVIYHKRGLGHTGSAGMVILLSEQEILIIACNTTVSVASLPGGRNAYIISNEEGHFENGTFVIDRILNGDEEQNLTFYDEPTVRRLKIFA